MTRKDYELLAAKVAEEWRLFGSNAQHAKFACSLAHSLARDNSAFSAARFLGACMPTSWVGGSKEAQWDKHIRECWGY